MTRMINRLNTVRSTDGFSVDRPVAPRRIAIPSQGEETGDRSFKVLPKIFHEGDALPACFRLFVLVPDCEINLNELAGKISHLAVPERIEVFLLTVPEHPDNKYTARCSISTLAAAVRMEELPVQIRVDSGGSYLNAVKALIHPGDVLVCYAEMTSSEVEKNKGFAETLAALTHLPVYTLNGALPRRKTYLSSQWIEVLLIGACLATIIAFFGLQVWIDRNLIGAGKTILELISVLVEIRVITLYAKIHF
jgi:hypothetical protein